MSLSLNSSVDIIANSVKIIEDQSTLDVADGLINTAISLLTKANAADAYK